MIIEDGGDELNVYCFSKVEADEAFDLVKAMRDILKLPIHLEPSDKPFKNPLKEWNFSFGISVEDAKNKTN